LAHDCPHFGHVGFVKQGWKPWGRWPALGQQIWSLLVSFPQYSGVSFLWMICYVTHQPHVFASVGMPIHVKWGWCVTKHMHEGLKGQTTDDVFWGWTVKWMLHSTNFANPLQTGRRTDLQGPPLTQWNAV
jgi:hypothetical protein